MATFKEVDAKTLDRQAERSSFNEVQSFIHQELDKWRATPLHVAVIGSSGQGKSSLINTVLDIADDPTQKAEVGVTETTKTMKPYQAKNNENIIFWDLPGVGTSEFPRATYLEKVKFQRYDFYIIVSALRFTEDDFWLAEQIVKHKKAAMFFVRSKVDKDISNDKKAHPRSHDTDAVLQNIRNYTMENISILKVDIPVFLVSNFHRDLYDLEKMTSLLLEGLPTLQQEALAMSFDHMTSAIIKKKAKALYDRIWKVATRSGSCRKVPISGTGLKMDVELLARELKFQNEQFGMDEMDVDSLCFVVRSSVQDTYLTKFTQQVSKSPSLNERGRDYWCAFMLLDDHLKFAKDYASVKLNELSLE